MLVWNFLIIGVFDDPLTYHMIGCVSLVAFSLTLPVAGWLADARVGRYMVIRCSIWIMWIATVLVTVSSVIAQLIEGYSSVNLKIQLLLYRGGGGRGPVLPTPSWAHNCLIVKFAEGSPD